MTVEELREARPADQPLLERLWLTFRHDMSEFSRVLPDDQGMFRSERLDRALSHDEPDWTAYVISVDRHPAGLATVRGLTATVRVLSGFFIVRGARRGGLGLRMARRLISTHPGPWEAAFQASNLAAVQFWRRVGADVAPDRWLEETRPVPGRPHLPPDVWITLPAT